VIVAAPPPPPAGLPCPPEVLAVKGVTYYKCGQSYFVQAYGSNGPMYMPVQAPSP
jgi:Meckel syndrome type 1 protein